MGIQVQPGKLSGMRPFRHAVRNEVQGTGLRGGVHLVRHPQGAVQHFRIFPAGQGQLGLRVMDGVSPVNGGGEFQFPLVGHDEGGRALFPPGTLGHVHGLDGTVRRGVHVKEVVFQSSGIRHQLQFIIAGVQSGPEAVDFRFLELNGSIQFTVTGADFFQLGPAFLEGIEFRRGAVQSSLRLGGVSFHLHNIR